MNGSLIDTNIIIKVLNGDKTVIEYFCGLDAVNISAVTVGELNYGALKSSRKEYNLQLFDGFINEYPVLNVDMAVSKEYGEIKNSLVKQGVNIPENDIWIAATAMANKLTLVSCDRHFTNIEGLNSRILN